MRLEIVFLIIGMTAVTYIPRVLPAVFAGKFKFSPKFEKFLRLIPYTAMSALIFPGIFSVDEQNPYIGIVGGAAAALLALAKMPVMVCVIGGIAADMILYMFAGC